MKRRTVLVSLMLAAAGVAALVGYGYVQSADVAAGTCHGMTAETCQVVCQGKTQGGPAHDQCTGSCAECPMMKAGTCPGVKSGTCQSASGEAISGSGCTGHTGGCHAGAHSGTCPGVRSGKCDATTSHPHPAGECPMAQAAAGKQPSCHATYPSSSK